MGIKKVRDLIIEDKSGVYGLGLSAEPYNGKVRYLRITDIDDSGNLLDYDKKSVTTEQEDDYLLKQDDLVVARTGNSTGRTYVYDKNDGPMVYAGFLIKYVFDKNKINPRYLKYFTTTSIYRNQTAKYSGSTRGNMSAQDFKNIKIVFPDRVTQDKLVVLFDSINKKLINNNKIIAELESMAKTLYDYWFLQFEFPNSEGKPYKSSGGKMVYNKELKREIPEGWKVENLMFSTLCKDIKAGVDYFDYKNYLPTANIDGENITDGENVTYDNRENRANMQPIKYSVWFAKMKNSIKHLTIPNNSDWFIKKYILSTGFQGLKCSVDSLSFIHCIVNSVWFENYKDVLSHGATQEGVNNKDLKNIKFAVPTNNVLKRFSNIVLPLLERKFSIIKENQELTSLRDFLLPMLMNGQVTFKS